MPGPPQVKCCIFCGNDGKKSQEHIWGKWIKKHVAPTMNKHGVVTHIIDNPGKEARSTQRIRAGDPISSSVPIVCVSCNNTWLSNIQEDAKSHLIPLFNGSKTLLDRVAQRKVATWIAMATITAEYLIHDDRQVAISNEERAEFMKTRKPSDDWRIWIAYYEASRLKDRWVHTSLPIYDDEEIPDVPHINGAPQANTQCTTVRIERLLFHVMSSREPKNIAQWDWRDDPRAKVRLVRLWPPQEQFVSWPVPSLTDCDAYRIARSFIQRCDAIATWVER